MTKTRQSYIYAGIAILFWSTVPTAFKLGLRETNILPLLTTAALTSTLIFFIAVIAGKKLSLVLKSTPGELFRSAYLGLINPFLYYLILLRAYQLLPAQVAQPLNMIWPVLLVFLSIPILHQKIERKSFIALVISFTGVYIISSMGKPLTPGQINLPGAILATSSSVLWAFYFILNVKDGRDEAVKLFLSFLFGSAYLIAATVVTGTWQTDAGLRGSVLSVYIGVFEMGLTFLFWLKALQAAPTTAGVSNLVYLAPIISLTLVHFILHEPVYYTTPAGLLLIMSGIYLQNRISVR